MVRRRLGFAYVQFRKLVEEDGGSGGGGGGGRVVVLLRLLIWESIRAPGTMMMLLFCGWFILRTGVGKSRAQPPFSLYNNNKALKKKLYDARHHRLSQILPCLALPSLGYIQLFSTYICAFPDLNCTHTHTHTHIYIYIYRL